MVLGLLALAALPTTLGVAEGISSSQKETDPTTQETLLWKFQLECFCTPNSPKAKKINGGRVVLRDQKLYIEPRGSKTDTAGHPFQGFYIEYPDPERPRPLPLGLVSTISREPPLLNWIYVDRVGREVKYGNRTQSRAHIVGSWGWDAGEEGGTGGLTLEGREGAVAVEGDGVWEIRWEDKDGNAGVEVGVKLAISLERKMVERREEDREREGNNGVKRTDTSTTSQRRKRAPGEPEKVDKAFKKGAKETRSAPKLEMSGTTIERLFTQK